MQTVTLKTLKIDKPFPDDTIMYFAAAGTGKTHTLITELKAALEIYNPSEVAYLSFTRKAATEAVNRIAAEVYKSNGSHYDAGDFEHIRTIHSLCFRAMGRTDKNFITSALLKEFEKRTGFAVQTRTSNPVGRYANNQNYYEVYMFERMTGLVDVDRLFNIRDYYTFKTAYDNFKKVNNLIDYEDCIASVLNNAALKLRTVKFLIIDEAQDLTVNQWRVCFSLFPNVKSVRIAGDDWQALFDFAGASCQIFLDLAKMYKTVKLEKTYRHPLQIAKLGADILSLVNNKISKNVSSAVTDVKSSVHILPDMKTAVDTLRELPGTSFILCRSETFKNMYKDLMLNAAIIFSIYGRFCLPSLDKLIKYLDTTYKIRQCSDIYTYCTKNGLKPVSDHISIYWKNGDRFSNNFPLWYHTSIFTDEEKIILRMYVERYGLKALYDAKTKFEAAKTCDVLVSTAFSTKGGEADNVFVDLSMGRYVYDSIEQNWDTEIKLLYTAITRAKKNVFFVMPSSKDSLYPFIKNFINKAIEEN